jgi:hypothetical protein
MADKFCKEEKLMKQQQLNGLPTIGRPMEKMAVSQIW